MPSRNTLVVDVRKLYTREKDKLRQMIARIPNRVCLTSDVWTTTTSEGYICETAHFVDENWRLTSKILNFCRMKPPHTGIEIEAVIFDYLKEWGIEKKIFFITLDNASANDSMQEILKNHLRVQSSLLSGGVFFYVRCSAHILNLIVQEGLKMANEALYKIRESVKYIRGSDGRMVKFKDYVTDAGIDTDIGLRLDVSTRWNSTYLMLESAIKYEKVFDYFKLADGNYKFCPSFEEWRRAEKICQFLEPFYEITNLISGSSYPTSNLYFTQVWQIECILMENLYNDDDVIKDMSSRMIGKFDKYWKHYRVILAFGAILDPRLNIDFLKYCYETLDHLAWQDKVNNVMEKLRMLYGEYVDNFSALSISLSQSSQPTSISLSQSHEEGNRPKRLKALAGYKKCRDEMKSTTGKSELEDYLEESQVDDDSEEYDVLLYWKTNEKRFPTLSIMARDVLSIPITIVASESAFSISGRVLTKYRSSTLPENVQMLICTRNWLHGFAQNPNEEEECNTFDQKAAIGESNVPLDVEE